MFVEIKEIPIKRIGRSRHTSKRIILYTCDTCGATNERKYTKKTLERIRNGLTFCDHACAAISRRKDGELMKKTQGSRDNKVWQERLRSTMLERHGVENPGQMSDHVKKTRQTLQERYGVNNALQLPQAREGSLKSIHTPEADEKRRLTNLKRWNSENVFESNEVKERIKQRLREQHGVDHSSHIPGIHEKRSKTCMINHGVRNGLCTQTARDNAQRTFIRRYGAPTYWQSEQFKALADDPIILQKRHETMKRNGTYGKSKIEDAIHKTLLERFPLIRRQESINGWAIDFYIPERDAYIQIDGVYWHGLDRPIESIRESGNLRDAVILKTIQRDQEQNDWFRKYGFTLLRFTDKDPIDKILTTLSTR